MRQSRLDERPDQLGAGLPRSEPGGGVGEHDVDVDVAVAGGDRVGERGGGGAVADVEDPPLTGGRGPAILAAAARTRSGSRPVR
jgi:hypothetical protein